MIRRLFKPAAAIAMLPAQQIAKKYLRWRLRMFIVAYIAYTTYYFGRSSFDVSKQYITTLGTDQLGFIGAALGIAYGLSKFLMGNVSDRSNSRVFLATGLLISGLVNLLLPSFLTMGAAIMMVVLMFVNGWVQGMGWPACVRIMTHWFSDRERGTKMGFWLSSHNAGAGLLAIGVVPLGILLFNNWHGLYYLAGILCILVAITILIFSADTPQSVGLPPIEEYRHDYPANSDSQTQQSGEQELSAKVIFWQYVLNNPWIWLIALANVFVYCSRYGILSWSTYYLIKVKHLSLATGLSGFALFELPSVGGIMLMGWLTDKVFNGRRAPLIVMCMAVFTAILFVYWHSTTPWILLLSLSIMGISIYAPVSLIGILTIDLVPKKAAGTATGLVGLFGYFFGTVGAQAVIGMIAKHYGWDQVFMFLVAAGVIATLLLSLCWNLHKRS